MEIRKILPLSQEVIGQIAAGEVVERPSAAIKELVENSMDAGATAVTVEIKEGGLSLIKITDNGSGIRVQDIRMAFERHATSKIRTANDLYGVETLGFRGEALASIAAVSHVQCISRTEEEEMGFSVLNDGGVLSDLKAAACPRGTTFIIRDLFYNAPVRKRFMKKPSAETAMVSEVMARLILSHPEISFRYVADGKVIFFSPGDSNDDSAVMSIYGLNILKGMTRVEGHMNGVLLKGFVGVGDIARGNRNYEHFFLNGRAMKSQILSTAVENACRQRVMIGRFPMCVLHLSVPFEQTDVHVHPNKWEVRFQNEQAVSEAVYTIVYEALYTGQKDALFSPGLFDTVSDNAPVDPAKVVKVKVIDPAMLVAEARENEASEPDEPVSEPAKPIPQPQPSRVSIANLIYGENASQTNQEVQQVPEPSVQEAPAEMEEAAPPLPPEPIQLESDFVQKSFDDAPPRFIGVVFNTYILLEYRDMLLLCDQHAAHERLLYEELMHQTASYPVSQSLLLPQVITLSHAQYALYEDNAEQLRRAGFDLEPFGDDSIQLRGVPIVLGEPRARDALLEALDTLERDGILSDSDKVSRIMQCACKHAVKGGEEVPRDSLCDLVKQIINNDIPPTCPHGRPLMITLTKTDLEKRFKRIQH